MRVSLSLRPECPYLTPVQQDDEPNLAVPIAVQGGVLRDDGWLPNCFVVDLLLKDASSEESRSYRAPRKGGSSCGPVAHRTGQKAELWPYVPYNVVAHPPTNKIKLVVYKFFTKNERIDDVPPSAGALIVNIADHLQLIANDKFQSVFHRENPPIYKETTLEEYVTLRYQKGNDGIHTRTHFKL